jgi:hypothetical protein
VNTKSLFHAEDKEDILRRFRALEPNTRPAWGKMTAAQMLAHCQVAFRLASGELRLKRAFIGILFGRIAKKQLLAPKDFGRNLPTAPEFRITGARDFAREKQQLIEAIERFAAAGPAGLTKEPHPFFGALTQAESEALMWKHLDHHLRQFGCA